MSHSASEEAESGIRSSRLQSAVNRGKTILLRIDDFSYPRFVVPLVGLLPSPIAYGVAIIRSDIRFRMMTSQRKEILYSLELLFGDQLTIKERDHIARDYFRMRSCELTDAMRLLGQGRALLGLVQVRGEEHLRAALARGKGVILCSAHFGSHKSVFSIIGARGFPVAVIARWKFDKSGSTALLNRLFYRLSDGRPVNSHLHSPLIERKQGNYGVALQAANVLRRNEVVGIMVDHEILPGDPSRPMTFGFLNRKAVLVPGAITLAQVTGARVMVMLSRRSADWRHQLVEIFPPIAVEGDPADAFKTLLAQIEPCIKRYPAQWMKLSLWDLVNMGLVSREVALLKPWRTAEARVPVGKDEPRN